MDYIAVAGKIVEAYNERQRAQKDEANILRILGHITTEINRVIDHLENMKMLEFTGRLRALQSNLKEYKPNDNFKNSLEIMRLTSNDLLNEIYAMAEKGKDIEQNKALAAMVFSTLYARALILSELKITFGINMDNDIVDMMQNKMEIYNSFKALHYTKIIEPLTKVWKEKNLPPIGTVIGIGPCFFPSNDFDGNYSRTCDKDPKLYDQIQSEMSWINLYANYGNNCLKTIQRITGMKMKLSVNRPTDYRCKNHKFQSNNWVLGNDKNGDYSNPSVLWDFDNIAAGMQVTFQASIRSEGDINRLSEIVIWELGENVHTNTSSGTIQSSTVWSSPKIAYKKVEELSVIRAEVYWHDQEETNQIIDCNVSYVQSSWE